MGLRMIPFFKAKGGRVNTGYGLTMSSGSNDSGGDDTPTSSIDIQVGETLIGTLGGKSLFRRYFEFDTPKSVGTNNGLTLIKDYSFTSSIESIIDTKLVIGLSSTTIVTNTVWTSVKYYGQPDYEELQIMLPSGNDINTLNGVILYYTKKER